MVTDINTGISPLSPIHAQMTTLGQRPASGIVLVRARAARNVSRSGFGVRSTLRTIVTPAEERT